MDTMYYTDVEKRKSKQSLYLSQGDWRKCKIIKSSQKYRDK